MTRMNWLLEHEMANETLPADEGAKFYGCNPAAVLKDLQGLAEKLSGSEPRPNRHPLDCTTIIGHYVDKQAARIAELEVEVAVKSELLTVSEAICQRNAELERTVSLYKESEFFKVCEKVVELERENADTKEALQIATIGRDSLADIVEAYKERDENRPPEPLWQPIETAPKGGTYVDLFADGMRYTACYWGKPHHECGEMGGLCDSEWHADGDGWIESTFNMAIGPDVTHWMVPPADPIEYKPSETGGSQS
jgi:hypothetical protein